jgi:hypothetical protein
MPGPSTGPLSTDERGKSGRRLLKRRDTAPDGDRSRAVTAFERTVSTFIRDCRSATPRHQAGRRSLVVNDFPVNAASRAATVWHPQLDAVESSNQVDGRRQKFTAMVVPVGHHLVGDS